jgi:hypothetical protein
VSALCAASAECAQVSEGVAQGVLSGGAVLRYAAVLVTAEKYTVQLFFAKIKHSGAPPCAGAPHVRGCVGGS